MDDVLLNKAAIIERCLRRIDEDYAGEPDRLTNFTYQDAIVLNLERACQAAIDIAMHIVARDHLGAPQTSAHAFDLIGENGWIDVPLARALRGMVGFRNIAIHEYQKLSIDVLRSVIEHGRDDLVALCAAVGVRIVASPPISADAGRSE